MDFHRVIFIVGALIASPALGETLYSPQNCLPKELTLSVRNHGTRNAAFWMQAHQGAHFREQRLDVPGLSARSFPGSELLEINESLSIKRNSKDLEFTLSCRGESLMTPTTSPSQAFELPAETRKLRLLLQNLDPSESKSYQVLFRDLAGRTLQSSVLKSAPSYQTSETFFAIPEGSADVLIQGTGRLSSRALNGESGQALTPKALAPAVVSTSDKVAYFLMTDQENSESYVVPLTDQTQIAEAREIIRQGLPKITVAQIEAVKSPGPNRNFFSEDRAPWSWAVKEVFGFADFAHISCDGTPALVEDRLNDWLRTEDQQICFWSFQLKRELSADEVSSGRLGN